MVAPGHRRQVRRGAPSWPRATPATLGGNTLAKLTREQIVTIEVLCQRGQPATQTARILGVTKATIRYHRRRTREGATDRRRKPLQVERLGLAEVVEHWWHAQVEALGDDRPPGVQSLHDFLREEYGYRGSYKSVRKFVRARFGRPRLQPFRRVETPPGAQTQSDWGEFPGVDLGGPEGLACSPQTGPADMRVILARQGRRTLDEAYPPLARADHPQAP